MKDLLKKYLFEDLSVRIQTVNLTQTWHDICEHQEFEPILRNLLGELSAAAVLLASNIKQEGTLILQLHGQGPIQLLVVECNEELQLRATMNVRQEFAIKATDTFQELLNYNGEGRFSVWFDPSNRPAEQQPYQGIVPIEGNNVAEVLKNYMRTSEQIDTQFHLAANDDKATGMLIQRIPHSGGMHLISVEEADEAWERAKILCRTIMPEEQLAIDEEHLVARVFYEEELRTYEPQAITAFCSCTKERVAAALKMLGRAEVESILEEMGQIEVKCHFCGKPYVYDPIDSAQLFLEDAQISSTDTSNRIN